MYYPIPVLLYHNISKEKNYPDVNVKAFHKQMKLMKRMGYETINLNGVDKKNLKKKFVITFDDEGSGMRFANLSINALLRNVVATENTLVGFSYLVLPRLKRLPRPTRKIAKNIFVCFFPNFT